jgi:putative endonuclease
MFAMVDFAARKGLAEAPSEGSAQLVSQERARRTGVRGETYAYWYLRRHGYVLIARNYTSPGTRGEIDIVGFDGAVLAFIEVKTRSSVGSGRPTPEEAVNREKRRHLVRVAGHFMNSRRLGSVPHRFDVLAIETRPGARPIVRLHRGAFSADVQRVPSGAY